MLDRPLDDDAANVVMATAHSAWSPEMIGAIRLGAVAEGEPPTKMIEAVIDCDGVEYIATLTFSIRAA